MTRSPANPGSSTPTELHRLYEELHGPSRPNAARAAQQAALGRQVVVVSACLAGEPVRFDGSSRSSFAIMAPLLANPGLAVLPLCPEILAGMGCPRPPVRRDEERRIVDEHGNDHTDAFTRGARLATELAVLTGATRAFLKERSPSCGVNFIHGPHGLIPGRGVFAELLAEKIPDLMSEEDVLKGR